MLFELGYDANEITIYLPLWRMSIAGKSIGRRIRRLTRTGTCSSRLADGGVVVGEEATDAARKKGVALIVDGVDITQDDPNVVRISLSHVRSIH